MLIYKIEKFLFLIGFAGADPTCRLKFRIVNELASQNFIHPTIVNKTDKKKNLVNYAKEDYTIIAAPGFKLQS